MGRSFRQAQRPVGRGMADWQPDVLGDGYEQQVLELGDDPDGQGQIVGTLVRPSRPRSRPAPCCTSTGSSTTSSRPRSRTSSPTRGRLLRARPAQVRPLAPPGQTPHYVSSLKLYEDAELSRALATVRHETGDAPVLLAGHSTGGLVLSLWLDRLNAGPGGAKGAGISGLCAQQSLPRPAGQAVDAELGHPVVPGGGEDPAVRAAQAAAHGRLRPQPARQRRRRVGLRP